MKELLYTHNSLLIAVGLLVLMLTALESGYRMGAARAATASDSWRSQVSAIEGAMLGLLALILGFTFSLALQRYDRRSEAVVEEANAIGTAWLRLDLLPATAQAPSRALMRDYIASRIAESRETMAEDTARRAWLARSAEISTALWQAAAANLRDGDSPHAGSLYVQALNDAIDALSTTEAVMERHVPEVVLLLLFVTFATTTATVGFASGIAAHRPPPAVAAMIVLIVLMTFLIIDLDRPRRGLIQVDQHALRELQAAAAAPDAP